MSKVLFLGLDNGGKTSIILSLKKDVNLLDYTSLEPTKKYEQKVFEDGENKISIWDFGGQQQYREDHLKNLNVHLTEATKINYVIDIQDQLRYDLSLQYFEAILKVLKNENISIKLSIFLHKYDPHLEFDEEIVSDLINKINDKIPPNFDFNIFKTSIYTVFRKISVI